MSAPATQPSRILVLGPPASGKGTHSRRLAAALGIDHLSTGAMLRQEIQAATELGQLAQPLLSRGQLLPDDLMCRFLASWLDRHPAGWLLDGFPRSLPQARFLDDWLASHHCKLDAALQLVVPYDELVRRIRLRVECPQCAWSGPQNATNPPGKCPVCATAVIQRADDNEQNLQIRYRKYIELTQPVIDHYRALNLLFPCDATAPQEQVAQTLLDRLAAIPPAANRQ